MDLLGNAEHGKLLNVNLALQALFSFALLICSFVVAATANAGFNAVLTAILSCTFVVGAYRVLNRSQSTLAVGFVIGVSTMMSFLMLMTAVFWGQLSGCEDVRIIASSERAKTHKPSQSPAVFRGPTPTRTRTPNPNSNPKPQPEPAPPAAAHPWRRRRQHHDGQSLPGEGHRDREGGRREGQRSGL
mmetsp:Transcript_10590/g.31985  ORF Transcript_10590/g.31985 Transcript_10590/m.31985 type:complete len:187 (+) Transcript_10590:242-802(+)